MHCWDLGILFFNEFLCICVHTVTSSIPKMGWVGGDLHYLHYMKIVLILIFCDFARASVKELNLNWRDLPKKLKRVRNETIEMSNCKGLLLWSGGYSVMVVWSTVVKKRRLVWRWTRFLTWKFIFILNSFVLLPNSNKSKTSFVFIFILLRVFSFVENTKWRV